MGLKSDRGVRTWQVYGLTFSSRHPFQTPLAASPLRPELAFDFCAEHLWTEAEWDNAEHVVSGAGPADWRVVIRKSKGQGYYLSIGGRVSFVITGSEILCHVESANLVGLAEIQFLDTALPLNLELSGVPVLHASAVEVDGRGLVFTAYAGGGKTSLAAGMTKNGAGFMADDTFAIRRAGSEFLVSPGYPQLRLWLDAAERLFGPYGHEPIDPTWPKRRVPVGGRGEFRTEPCPLGAIYFVDCRDEYDDVRISRLGGHAELLKVLYNCPAMAALDLRAQAQRMIFFADVIGHVPVSVLSYPRRYDRFPEVISALSEGVSGRGAARPPTISC